MESYSVLMSVYHKANPTFFHAALESLVNQTVPSNDIVIVCDGPLTPELDTVLEHYQGQYPEMFHIVRLEQNVGIGEAANVGLAHCKNDLIAKMDADDIAVPQRCEWQLARTGLIIKIATAINTPLQATLFIHFLFSRRNIYPATIKHT